MSMVDLESGGLTALFRDRIISINSEDSPVYNGILFAMIHFAYLQLKFPLSLLCAENGL